MNVLDFNHGSMAKPDDPKSGPLDDRINRLVDAYFQKTNQKEQDDAPRPYVGASLIGEECPRAIQLNYIHEKHGNLPEGPAPFPGHILRTFKAGHVFEDMAVDALRGSGFDVDAGYIDEKNRYRQHGFTLFDGQYKGHFDGIVRSGPVFREWPRLWECKALNNNGTNSVLNKGLEEAKPQYYAQVQANQYESGITEPCWFTIINKDTSRWYHMLIGHEPAVGKAMREKAKYIIDMTAAGRLVDRPYNDPNNYKCREWCRWNEVCWKKLP